jgi:predicted small secreted protein
MRRLVLAPILLAAVALAGCTTAGSGSSSKKFSGAAGDVADAVGDLETAGKRKDADRLCSELLARSLVEKLDAGGTSCKQEMKDALADADEFALSVRDVKVSGNEATATVRQGSDGPTRTIQLVKEGTRWKASEFSTG